MRVEVKICGLTRPEDAALAVAGGASYLGVVFASGSRTITADGAKAVVAAAGLTPVFGVFGDQPVDQILELAATTGLRGAQLHGPYPREAAATLRAGGLLVWRVARLADVADLDRLDDMALDADAVLVEPHVTHLLGGAGVPLGVEIAVAARRRLQGHRMALAGGLTAERVAEIAALVRPDVVDVSSGVEYQPGIKDPIKVTRFLEAVLGHSSPI